MRLLHGSYTEILTPDLSKCKGKNDFGKGFYLTPNWDILETRILKLLSSR